MTTEAPARRPSPDSGFGGALESWRRFRKKRYFGLLAGLIAITLAALVPFLWSETAAELDAAVFAIAYVMFALGLNIVVGFAGLLDLGYVAFFAIGAYTMGWLGSGFYAQINHGKGVHVAVSTFAGHLPGIHINFLLVLIMVFRPQGLLGEETREAG